MRRPLVAFCKRLLQLFFRRIEVVGQQHVPETGAVVFAANHPNGLLDPLLLLCSAPRPVSFLAKEPLFRTPLIGYFVRSFECLPVYRSQDGADPAKNKRVLQAAADLLQRGNALGLFPEGVSHSSPELMRFKSGASRMALAARALSQREVHLLPVFLYYEQKQTFRSRAVLAYGPPLLVPDTVLDESGEAPPEIVNELTARLRDAVGSIAPTAESVEALVLAERAERLLDLAEFERSGVKPSLAERMHLRRALLNLHTSWTTRQPARVADLLARLKELSDAFDKYDLPIDAHRAPAQTLSKAWFAQLIGLGALAIPGSIGFVLHTPAYQLVRYLAARYSGKETDVEATAKLLAGLLLFPLTWFIAASVAVPFWGWWGFALGLALGPVTALCALQLLENLGWMARQYRRSGRRAGADYAHLVERRRVLADDIRRLMAEPAEQDAQGLSPGARL